MDLDIDHLRKVETKLRGIVKAARLVTLSMSAEMLEHYLDGKGAKKTVNPDTLHLSRAFRMAEERLMERLGLAFAFEITDLLARGGGTKWVTQAHETLTLGEQSTEHLKQPVNPHRIADLYWASGGSMIYGKPRFHVAIRDGEIEVDGSVEFLWLDRYRWNLKEEAKAKPVEWISWLTPGIDFTINDLDALRMAGLADEFDMESRWSFRLRASGELERMIEELSKAGSSDFRRWERALEDAAISTDMNVMIGRANFQGPASGLFRWEPD
jgi:hypothetical protein